MWYRSVISAASIPVPGCSAPAG
uniref:Uncharacterized protein n=1 Tax=Arundo donax TaxID=35708 RepID=A0A0A9EB32_ARUDO